MDWRLGRKRKPQKAPPVQLRWPSARGRGWGGDAEQTPPNRIPQKTSPNPSWPPSPGMPHSPRASRHLPSSQSRPTLGVGFRMSLQTWGCPASMGVSSMRRVLTAVPRKLVPPCAALSIATCSGSGQYMGISPTSPTVPADVRDLAIRAQTGDKQAQLELRIAFEKGRGVAQDIGKARTLYRLAATDSGGTMWVYSPPVGKGTSGRVIPIDRGPVRTGLQEARARLEALDE